MSLRDWFGPRADGRAGDMDGDAMRIDLEDVGANDGVTQPKSALAKLLGVTGAGMLLALVSQWEGKSNDPYRDLVGVWTVCYGETQQPMRRYTDAECKAMLERRLVDYAGPVLKRNPELRNHPHMAVAASSLAYNIGTAAYNRSSVARMFSAGQYRAACDAFLRYRFAGGREVKGLVNRRRSERAICLKGLT